MTMLVLPCVWYVDQDGLEFEYTDHRGETRRRDVVPLRIWYGITEYYKKPQWLLNARDRETGELRDFAMNEMRP